jgi:hypothetical protein
VSQPAALYDSGKYDQSLYESTGPPPAPADLGLRHEFTYGATTRVLPDIVPGGANERLGGYKDRYAIGGGMISATGTISEAEYLANTTVYRQGATWKVFDTNLAEYVFRGDLIEPVRSGGVVELSADGDARRADHTVERFLISNQNPEMWVPGDQEPFGPGGNGYKGTARIHNDIFGNTLVFEVNRFTSFKKNNNNQPSSWDGDLRVFWAPLTPLKWLSFNLDASTPDANYELQLCGTTTGPSGPLDVIRRFSLGGIIKDATISGTIATYQMKDGIPHRLRAGDVITVNGMTPAGYNSGTVGNPTETFTVLDPAPGGNDRRFTVNIGRTPAGPSTSSGNFKMSGTISYQIPPSYDLIGLRVIRDTETKKAEHRRWTLRQVKVGALATSAAYYLHNAYIDLFSLMGAAQTNVVTGTVPVQPYDSVQAALGQVADDLSLLDSWYWRMWVNPSTGTRMGEAGPIGTKTWNVKLTHTPIRALPQRVYNKVSYEYAYGGGYTAIGEVTASPNPFPVGYEQTFVLQMDEPPIKVIADQFAQKVANYLSKKKFSGQAILYEVEDPAAPGVAVKAGEVKPGDKLILTNNDNVEVYIGEMSRSEDGSLIDVSFTEGNPILDNWLANRQRRMNMGLSSNAATLALIDPALPARPAAVRMGFVQSDRKKGDPEFVAEVDWDAVKEDINGNGTAVDTYHVWYRPIKASTDRPVSNANGGGWRKHAVRESRDHTTDNPDDDPIITTPTEDRLDRVPNPKDWKWEVWVRAEDLLGQLSDWTKLPVSSKPVNFRPASPSNVTFDVDQHDMTVAWTLPGNPVLESIAVTATGTGSVMTYLTGPSPKNAAGVPTYEPMEHRLDPGDTVTITGMTPTTYNGVKTVVAVPTRTSFTVAGTATGAGTGGIADYASRELDPSIDHTWVQVSLDNTFRSSMMFREDRRVDGTSKTFRYTLHALKSRRSEAGLNVNNDPSNWTLFARVRTVDQWGNFSTDNAGTWTPPSGVPAAPHRPGTPPPPDVSYFRAEAPGRWGKLKIRVQYTAPILNTYALAENNFDVLDTIMYQVEPCNMNNQGQPIRRYTPGGARWGSQVPFPATDVNPSPPPSHIFVDLDDIGDMTHYVKRDFFYRCRAKFIDKQGRDSVWSQWSGQVAPANHPTNPNQGLGSQAIPTLTVNSLLQPGATVTSTDEGVTQNVSVTPLQMRTTPKGVYVEWEHPKTWTGGFDEEVNYFQVQVSKLKYSDPAWQQSDIIEDDTYANARRAHFVSDGRWPTFPDTRPKAVFARVRSVDHLGNTSAWTYDTVAAGGSEAGSKPGEIEATTVGAGVITSYTQFANSIRPVGIIPAAESLGAAGTSTDLALHGPSGTTDQVYPEGATVVWLGARPPTSTGPDGQPIRDANGNIITVTDAPGKLWRVINGVWTKQVDGLDIMPNSITTGSIAAGAVRATEIRVGTITGDKFFSTVSVAQTFELTGTSGTFRTAATGSRIEMNRNDGPDVIKFINSGGAVNMPQLRPRLYTPGGAGSDRQTVELIDGDFKFGQSYLASRGGIAGAIWLAGLSNSSLADPGGVGATIWFDTTGAGTLKVRFPGAKGVRTISDI